MLNNGPSKTGLLITIGVLVIVLIVTVWLFHYLTDPPTRSDTFGFTLTFICFLEFLSLGYLAVMFIPRLRKGVVWALYPVIGIIIGLYVVVSVVIVIGYNLFSVFISSPKAYFTTLAVESVLFIIVLGSIIVLNAYKKAEDITIAKERRELTDLSVSMQEIYQNFFNCRSLLDIQTYRDVEQDIRKLKEKFQFCTPFGRSNAGVTEIEEKIQKQITLLSKLVEEIHSSPKKELGEILEKIRQITSTTLQAMDRREKLLVK